MTQGARDVAVGILAAAAVLALLYTIIALGFGRLGEPWGYLLTLLLIVGVSVGVLMYALRIGRKYTAR
jgi:hypothetical protein